MTEMSTTIARPEGRVLASFAIPKAAKASPPARQKRATQKTKPSRQLSAAMLEELRGFEWDFEAMRGV
jgi:hypothetical protein